MGNYIYMRNSQIKKYIYLSITLFIIITIGIYFMTYGSWQMMGEEFLSATFDSLATNLKQFRFNVDPNIIGIEPLCKW